MAQRMDAPCGQESAQARGREILTRWCVLAEQRLDHLTELFETGRWRRYHSELSFLENIQEAKNAVETWRRLATHEASLDNAAIDVSWLNSSRPLPPRRNVLPDFQSPPLTRRMKIRAAPTHGEAPLAEMPEGVLQHIVAEPAVPERTVAAQVVSAQEILERLVPQDIPSALVDDNWQQALDLSVMQQRYPLLRNAL